jgi:fatty-acyl-CoA synthase
VLSGAEVAILDDMGEPLEFGTQGKVAIRSPWAVSAYEGDISGGAFEGDWFFPGDLGVLTQEGDLRITGRTIETLNFGGEKFIASDLETKILDLPGVRDAFVTLVRHQNRERLVVMVVSDETPETLSPAVKGTFHTNLAFTLVPVEQIPRNHMGKLNRPALTVSIEQNLRVRPLGADE